MYYSGDIQRDNNSTCQIPVNFNQICNDCTTQSEAHLVTGSWLLCILNLDYRKKKKSALDDFQN